MSFYYYALNHEAKKAYDLNKGCWYSIGKKDNERSGYFLDTSDLAKLVEFVESQGFCENYALRIAESLRFLGNELEIVSSGDSWWEQKGGFLCRDDMWDNETQSYNDGYNITGSVYDLYEE